LLLDAILDRGRELGFTTAGLGVLIGNEPARAAYLKHGFEVASDKRTSDFEAALGAPGIEHLARAL
jgi:RimJ/RimL family protein N-acetyltransferase